MPEEEGRGNSASGSGPWPLLTLVFGFTSLGLLAYAIVRESVLGANSVAVVVGASVGVPVVIGIAWAGERWPRKRWILSALLSLPGIVALAIAVLQSLG